MKHCVSCVWKMDEKTTKRKMKDCGSKMKHFVSSLWKMDKKSAKEKMKTLWVCLVCRRWMKKLLKNNERLWIKDETLCVNLCERKMEQYCRKDKKRE